MGNSPEQTLRRGWTTGACATAAAHAAYAALLTGRFPDPVAITLPRGGTASFRLAETALADDSATAGVTKDAGDDPDVTHGALIRATVAPGPTGTGVRFVAGEGVGTVTLPGLPIPVGEPAINPKPRAMMAAAIAEVAAGHGGSGDVAITIAIPGGAALAQQTSNPRLGIVGGLSVLGTTGVVIPYSCSSWIHSIHRGIDVARAAGLDHLAAATGRTSEATVRRLYGLPEQALLEIGDFAGATLKYLRRRPVPRLTIAGGFAKLSKLADGAMDLHSDRSTVDIAGLARRLAEAGAPRAAVDRAAESASAGAVLAIADEVGMPLADRVAARARTVALAALPGGTAVDIVVTDRAGNIIGRAGP